jgi:hypothetical protein
MEVGKPRDIWKIEGQNDAIKSEKQKEETS